MKRLIPLVAVMIVAGCESGPADVPPKEPQFVTDDCTLIAAIGRDRYHLGLNDPARSIRLNGEDAPWSPGCDWRAAGFNVVQIMGPEGEAATAGMERLTFNRPRYDAEGALVRTSITVGQSKDSVLCRLVRGSSGAWTVKSCGPDPKLTQPREAAPSPADQTPDGKIIPPNGTRPVTARDLSNSQPDPGASPGPN